MLPFAKHRRSDRLASVYIGAVIAGGAWVLTLSLGDISRTAFGAGVLAWAAMAILTLMAGRFTVRLPLLGCRVSISDAFIFLSILLFGAALATLTGALDGYAASARQKGTWIKRAFNTAGMAISVNLSARLFAAAMHAGGIWGDKPLPIGRLILPVLFLGVAQFLLNTAIVSGVVRLKEGVPVIKVWRSSLRWTGTAYMAGAVAAAVVFVMIQHAGVLSVVAILPFPAVLYVTYQAASSRPLAGKLPVRS